MQDSPRLLKLRAMLDAEPGDSFCLYAIAQECTRLDRHAEAIDWFDRTIAADPRHAYARFHKARLLERLGRAADARRELELGLAAAMASGDEKAANEIAGALAAMPA